MNEPLRLRDRGPDDLRALLARAPRTQRMSRQDKLRTRARVAPVAAVAAGVGALAWLEGAAIGAGLGALAVGIAAAAGMPARVVPPVRTVVSASVASASVASGTASVSSGHAPAPPAIDPSPSDRPEAPPAHPSAAHPNVAPSAAHRLVDRPASAAPDAPPPANVDTLAEEAALLERARRALGENPREALALTETHATRFHGGKLGIERELLAIDALRRLGQRSEALRRARALEARGPGGLYDERLRKLVEGLQ